MDILRKLRGNRSQQELAEKIGLSQKSYSNYELGYRECDYATLIKLADYFDVSIDYLITGNQHPKDAPTSRIQQIYDSLSTTAQRYILDAAESIYRMEHGTHFTSVEDITRQN